MNTQQNRVIAFSTFTVDFDARELSCANGPVEVEPQVFDLIALFCANPGRLIGHDEIIEKVWQGRIVSDSAIATRINAARKALGDDGTAQRVIKTLRGRGFRFELMPTSATQSENTIVSSPDLERFVLSCTPHGYSLLMATRASEVREDWREFLPALLEEAANNSNGKVEATNLAVFNDGANALNCASDLLGAIKRRCAGLPKVERWTAKLGISYGTLNHGFAYAMAGRLDAVADPNGICITKRVKDLVEDAIDIDAVAMNESESLSSSAYKLSRIGDLTLSRGRKVRPAQIFNLEMPEPNEISVMALPFDVVGEDEELSQVALGLRLEIQTALAQLSGVLPIAAGTAAAFSGATSPEAAEAVGVRYVLQGNLRAIGRRVRLMLELYDHQRGGVSWSQSYEGSLDEGFDFQDKMTARVVRALDVKVLSGEQARIWHQTLGSLKAIRLQYKGMRDFFRMSRECMRSSRESFELLHQLHPDVPTGSTWMSLCHWFELQRGWTDDPEASSERVKHWADLAMKMEDADGQAHTALCHVHLLNRNFDKALEIGERAITIRPSCANANGFYAHSLYFCGSLDKAIHHARLAIRFSPVYPPLFAAVLSGALHARGDQETAIAIVKDSLRLNQKDGHARVILCSALIASGREQEARSVAVDLLRMEPDFQVAAFIDRQPFRNQVMHQQLAGNFTKAIEDVM